MKVTTDGCTRRTPAVAALELDGRDMAGQRDTARRRSLRHQDLAQGLTGTTRSRKPAFMGKSKTRALRLFAGHRARDCALAPIDRLIGRKDQEFVNHEDTDWTGLCPKNPWLTCANPTDRSISIALL